MNNVKEQFGLRIKELRQARNWTQEYLAEQLGMEPQNLSRMEKGIHMPNMARIETLAKIFDVKIYELFMFEHFVQKEQLIGFINNYVEKATIKELQFLCKIISANSEKSSRLS